MVTEEKELRYNKIKEMADKPVKAVVKLQLQAGAATPAPPVGTVLGPHGINLPGFVKQFNDATAKDKGLVIPVVVTIYGDRYMVTSVITVATNQVDLVRQLLTHLVDIWK